jgi:hypothetical protein
MQNKLWEKKLVLKLYTSLEKFVRNLAVTCQLSFDSNANFIAGGATADFATRSESTKSYILKCFDRNELR